jgi:hypothetical protein
MGTTWPDVALAAVLVLGVIGYLWVLTRDANGDE